jgi:hypothetical protein
MAQSINRVSSQLTIVLRIVLPTIWFTTIVSLVGLLGWAIRGKAGLFGNPFIWIGLLLILGSGLLFFRLVLWRYYRIDMDSRFLYVSDYFRTFKYPFSDIESITESTSLPGRVFCIMLKSKGSFGKKLYFLASQVLWQDFIKEHPEQMDSLLKLKTEE